MLDDAAGQLVGCGDVGVVGGEEPGEVAHRTHVDLHGGERLAGGQPEPGVALDRSTQPRLDDLGEVDPSCTFECGDAEDVGTPDVAGVLAVRVDVLGQIGQPRIGVAQLPNGPRPGAGPAGGDGLSDPVIHGSVQQRGHVGGGEQIHELADHLRDQPHRAVIMAALDGVADLEAKLEGQTAQVERINAV